MNLAGALPKPESLLCRKSHGSKSVTPKYAAVIPISCNTVSIDIDMVNSPLM